MDRTELIGIMAAIVYSGSSGTDTQTAVTTATEILDEASKAKGQFQSPQSDPTEISLNLLG